MFILELMINLRQNHLHLIHLHLHQMMVQREINLVVVDEFLLKNVLDLFGRAMRVIDFGI